MLVQLPVFCLVYEIEDAVPVKAVVLIPDELEVSLTVCLIRQVMVLHFHQEAFDLLVVLVDQLVDLLPQALVKLPDPLEVGLHQWFLRLPNWLQLVLDLRDELNVSFGVLMDVDALAALAEEQIFLAVLGKTKVGDFLAVALANPKAHLNKWNKAMVIQIINKYVSLWIYWLPAWTKSQKSSSVPLATSTKQATSARNPSSWKAFPTRGRTSR